MFGNPQAPVVENILQMFLEAPYDDETTSEKIGSCNIEIDENLHSSIAIIRRFSQLSELLGS